MDTITPEVHNPDPLLSMAAAGEYLHVSRSFIEERVRDGRIPSVRIAGTRAVRIRRSVLDGLIAPNTPAR